MFLRLYQMKQEPNRTNHLKNKKMFMGTKNAIFIYATKALGGYVDVDFFK